MRSAIVVAMLMAAAPLLGGCEECTEDGDCKEDQFCQFATGDCDGEDGNGICIDRAKNCVDGLVVGDPPVCGCDNQDYQNDCLRREAGVSKLNEGACP